MNEPSTTPLPTSPERLLAILDELGIEAMTHAHSPVFTVEEAKALRGSLPGFHIKNLFLRNKKEEMWLIVVGEDKPIDLKALGERLGAGRLSFGSAERLMRYLGVHPGSVTPFAIVNDMERQVQVVIDQDLIGDGLVNCHPLVNDQTTALKSTDLLRFLEAMGHAPRAMDFPGAA